MARIMSTILFVTMAIAVAHACEPDDHNGGEIAYMALIPGSANLEVGQSAQFYAALYTKSGHMAKKVASSQVSWSTTGGIGNVSPKGIFAAASEGKGSVTANYYYEPQSVGFVATAPVAVHSHNNDTNKTNSTAWLEMIPKNASLNVGQAQQFVVLFHASNGSVIGVQVNWSTSGKIGTVTDDGLFNATSAGSGNVEASYKKAIRQNGSPLIYEANASVIVNSVANSTNVTFFVSPQYAALEPGQTQQFRAVLTIDGVPQNVSAIWSLDLTPGAGTLSAGGLFSALSQGSAVVIADYYYGPNETHYKNVALVNVSAGTENNATKYLEIIPSSAAVTVGQTKQFLAVFHSGQNSIPLNGSGVGWNSDNATVGTVSKEGLFTALFAGSTNVIASYNGSSASYEATAMVSVGAAQVQPSAGSGSSSGSGSNNGGGAFKTSTLASFTCAGKPGTVRITYLVNNQQSAVVEIYFIGAANEKVMSKVVNGSDSFEFTPERAGKYEARVSLGKDQASAYFTVPACSENQANEQKNVTVNLLPKKELVLSKTVRYNNGFTKKFEVYRTTEGSSESYNSQITLVYESNFSVNYSTVVDFAPKTVLASVSQIEFETRPTRTTSGASLEFEWDVKTLANGERLTYKYSFARPLTEQIIDTFAAPKLIYSSTRKGQDNGSLFSAALFGLDTWNQWQMCLMAIIVLLLLFLIFSRKKCDACKNMNWYWAKTCSKCGKPFGTSAEKGKTERPK